jgi:hypothetical protein
VTRRPGVLFDLVFAALAVLAAVPLWLVQHPPIEDLPQHLAAIRVLHDFHDPALHFARYFELHLGRTQYLAYYLAADLLAYLSGVIVANKLLVSAAIIATPYAMRALLRALGRDERLALFVLPLTWNAHLVLGFLNFIAAIPLSLAGLALAVNLRLRWSLRRAVLLAVVIVVTFYTHVVPFGFLGLGAALVGVEAFDRMAFRREALWSTARRWLPLLPAIVAVAVWFKTAPAGQSTLTAALGKAAAGGPQPKYAAWLDSLREAPDWLTNVLVVKADDKLLVGWALLVMLAIGLGAGARDTDRAPSEDDVLRGTLTRRLAWLAPLAAFFYFITPTGYGWIWPINARFPLLALIFLVPVLPAQRRLSGTLVFAGVVAISVLSFNAVGWAFQRFEKDEVGQLDAAIEQIPKGERVAGLIFNSGSRYVRFTPFLHSVAWYQATRGGAVMFTFADFPESPFSFREDNRPPRVRPRWEWEPGRVDPARDLGWYQYVLVRGGPGRIAQERNVYQRIWRSPRWSVWKRIRGGAQAP